MKQHLDTAKNVHWAYRDRQFPFEEYRLDTYNDEGAKTLQACLNYRLDISQDSVQVAHKQLVLLHVALLHIKA